MSPRRSAGEAMVPADEAAMAVLAGQQTMALTGQQTTASWGCS